MFEYENVINCRNRRKIEGLLRTPSDSMLCCKSRLTSAYVSVAMDNHFCVRLHRQSLLYMRLCSHHCVCRHPWPYRSHFYCVTASGVMLVRCHRPSRNPVLVVQHVRVTFRLGLDTARLAPNSSEIRSTQEADPKEMQTTFPLLPAPQQCHCYFLRHHCS